MSGNELQYVWSGLTPALFALAAARFLTFCLAALLVLKHVFWFARGYHQVRDRRQYAVARGVTELATALAVGGVYGVKLYRGGATAVLSDWEAAVHTIVFAILFFSLMVAHDETRPPPPRSEQSWANRSRIGIMQI